MEHLYISTAINDKELLNEALEVFVWYNNGSNYDIVKDIKDSTYSIITYDEEIKNHKSYKRSMNHKYYTIFHGNEFIRATNKFLGKKYNWTWKYSKDEPAYEVTSRGDRRYSPFFQKVRYNDRLITLEDYYRSVIKHQQIAGTYKGGLGHKVMIDYLNDHKGLIYELLVIGSSMPFSDMFDKHGGQNKWYSEILNEIVR